MNRSRVSSNRRRRGIIFITAMWVIVILGAIVLLLARSMRVELAAAGNRLSVQQATTIELGAEQYVISAVDGCGGDAVSVLQTPAEQISLGDGYFWILQTYPDDDYTYAFGITDENSKLNLNIGSTGYTFGANADAALALLPGMPQDVADSIVKWTGSNAKTQGQGADSSYYGALPRPYTAKGSNFETVEELYLLKDVDDRLMWGNDLDHNGMIDNNELDASGPAAAFNSANDTGRGIFPFITVWGTEPNTDANGKARVNISLVTGNTRGLRTALSALPAGRVNQIVARASTIRQFRNIFEFALATGMKASELSQVADHLTTSTAKAIPGLVNVNTASQQVLMCLSPLLTQQDVLNLVNQRGTGSSSSAGALGSAVAGASGTTTPTDYTWIMGVLTPQKAAAIGNYITGRSFFYSADIVAVSGDGRAFKRVRIVVDARNSPPVIVYRKDLTYMGWPLLPDILTALKTHAALPSSNAMGTGSASGLSVLQQ